MGVERNCCTTFETAAFGDAWSRRGLRVGLSKLHRSLCRNLKKKHMRSPLIAYIGMISSAILCSLHHVLSHCSIDRSVQ